MTLRRKLLLMNVALLAGLLAVAAASLWGLLRQRTHVRASMAEYASLKWVELAELGVVNAKAKLHEPGATPAQAAPQLRAALKDLRTYKAVISQYAKVLPPEININEQNDVKARTRSASAKLTALVFLLDPPRRRIAQTQAAAPAIAPPAPSTEEVSARADEVTRELADLLRVCNTFMNTTQLESDRDLRTAIAGVCSAACAVALFACLASVWQYRRITVPLRLLRGWSRGLAAGDFSRPYKPTGDREFLELGRDLNQMAGELEAFYRTLKEMVDAKSKELVRSERLASVGFLAAGVAHEINNPLSVMAGYAELSVKRLRRLADPDLVADVLGWQEVIRAEAFRCKQITGKLLSMVKGGGQSREQVSITREVSEVAIMVRGIRDFRGRRLRVAIHPGDPLNVHANANELKQVLLNLMINALEAVSPATGEVIIDARRDDTWIELTVHDNGRGMNRATLDRVFEPFYTDKRGSGQPGTGLGLSITHAILNDHGGMIRADSPGPGKGSCFTIRLPACSADAESHAPAPRLPAPETKAHAIATTEHAPAPQAPAPLSRDADAAQIQKTVP
ncbi:MAG TPA: HAMP domain-containing sensor histidine kinase [Tepidisphaeraceae bacterium]|nr:HAMP domain-containing sensor histidine kinase [Tepidisphaeraceae bacterium]